MRAYPLIVGLSLISLSGIVFGAPGAGVATEGATTAGAASEILAEPPSDLIVTVYRAPYRDSGSIDLDDLNGFALVTETRLVRLPAGVSRVRFEGVADGIEPSSALITGLPGRVIEKNRDARLLSPSALIASAVGKPVELLRTNRKTGSTERLPGTILSDAGGGVVFKTDQGIEALRCSGLPETFSFEPLADLSARPTLSVEVQSPTAVTQQVTLSYLARGFDWAADSPAPLSQDGKRLGDSGQFKRRRLPVSACASGRGQGQSRERSRRRDWRSRADRYRWTDSCPMLAARLDQRSATPDSSRSPRSHVQEERCGDGARSDEPPGDLRHRGKESAARAVGRLKTVSRPRADDSGQPPIEAGTADGSVGHSRRNHLWRGPRDGLPGSRIDGRRTSFAADKKHGRESLGTAVAVWHGGGIHRIQRRAVVGA